MQKPIVKTVSTGPVAQLSEAVVYERPVVTATVDDVRQVPAQEIAVPAPKVMNQKIAAEERVSCCRVQRFDEDFFRRHRRGEIRVAKPSGSSNPLDWVFWSAG